MTSNELFTLFAVRARASPVGNTLILRALAHRLTIACQFLAIMLPPDFWKPACVNTGATVDIYESRTALTMTSSSIEQQSSSLTAQTEELSTPHFDDSAVATAHKVEPLPKRAAIRSESSRRMLIVVAAVVVGILLGISAVMISSASRHNTNTPTISTDAWAEMDSLDEPTPKPATVTVANIQQKVRPRELQLRTKRTLNTYMAEDFADDETNSSRRAPRRVGVIYYGRSPSEQ